MNDLVYSPPCKSNFPAERKTVYKELIGNHRFDFIEGRPAVQPVLIAVDFAK